MTGPLTESQAKAKADEYRRKVQGRAKTNEGIGQAQASSPSVQVKQILNG